jgi:ABC-2 type transport system ATP-binding protein
MIAPAAGQILFTLEKLTKRYGGRNVVDGLDLELPAGRIMGFLGPNGAGKSTTLFMLLGLVRPTSGKVRLFGKEGSALREARQHVGALVESAAFYSYLSGQKNLEILARIQGLPAEPHIHRVLDRVGLLPYRNQRVGTYSHGMRQRLGIAQALLGNPRLLVLDEPTNGLDPEGSHEVWTLLRSLVNNGGVTAFISSHLLSEVEE